MIPHKPLPCNRLHLLEFLNIHKCTIIVTALNKPHINLKQLHTHKCLTWRVPQQLRPIGGDCTSHTPQYNLKIKLYFLRSAMLCNVNMCPSPLRITYHLTYLAMILTLNSKSCYLWFRSQRIFILHRWPLLDLTVHATPSLHRFTSKVKHFNLKILNRDFYILRCAKLLWPRCAFSPSISVGSNGPHGACKSDGLLFCN